MVNTADTDQRVRALAHAADLPQGFEIWSAVQARLPQVRRRRMALRAATMTAASLALAAGIAVPLTVTAPASAQAAARRAAAVASTGAGLPPFELTEVTSTASVRFQPEPPPPRVIEHVEYAGPSHWRDQYVITEPFHEGTQAFTQIRNGMRIATVADGQVTISRASPSQLPSAAAWQVGSLRKMRTAGSVGRCAPSASLGNGPLIDGRPTLTLSIGPSPCPSADVPQADGPATFWLDKQTFLVLRADLHGPGGRLDQTMRVTSLRYHPSFRASTFRLPRPSPRPTTCSTSGSLPSLAALRRALAAPLLIPASLPDGLRMGAIASAARTTSSCKITSFTITYLSAAGHPAVLLYEAPQDSAAVRFAGRAVTLRPGLTATVATSGGWTFVWWIQDGRYCDLQSGGITAGVPLIKVPVQVLLRIASSLRM